MDKRNFVFHLPPSGKTTDEGANWEVVAKLDSKGILKDKRCNRSFKMCLKVNERNEYDMDERTELYLNQ